MFFGHNIGCVGWFYVNASFNQTLLLNLLSYTINPNIKPVFRGYQNKTFVGNVIGYPYLEGWIIKNTTIFNKTYNNLTIFFNQYSGAITPNYLNASWSKPFVKKYINNPVSNIQLLVYNLTPNSITGLNSTLTYNTPTSFISGSFGLNFNLGVPYYVFYSGIYPNIPQNSINNFTLNWIPNLLNAGVQDFNYTLVGNSEKLISYGGSSISFLNWITEVKNSSFSGNLFIYINPKNAWFGYNASIQAKNTIQLTSNDMYLNIGNNSIYNTTNSNTINYGIFFNTHQYTANFKYNNIFYYSAYPALTYTLIPAYTTNYSITMNGLISNIVVPKFPYKPCPINNISGWYKDFNYRMLVNVTNWNYTLAGVKKITIQNVPYLIFTMPHYKEMGNNCQYIYFNAYDNITNITQGYIPFAINSCNSSTASFVLNYQTNESKTYSSFYIYIESRSNNTIYNNQTIFNNFEQLYNSPSIGNSIPIKDYIVHFDNGLSPYTSLNISGYLGGVPFLNLSGRLMNDLPYISNYFNWINGSTIDKTFLILPNLADCGPSCLESKIDSNGVYGDILYGNGGGGHANLQNLTTSSSHGLGPGVQAATSLKLSLTNTNATFRQPYTTNYTTNANNPTLWTKYMGCIIPKTSNQSVIILPTTPNSPINSLIGNNLYQKNTATILSTLGLNKQMNLGTFNIPITYLIIMVIFGIIMLFGIFANEHIIMIVGVIAFWILGIFNIQALYIAIIISIIVAVYEIFEVRSHG
jgi:hypothetical protein